MKTQSIKLLSIAALVATVSGSALAQGATQLPSIAVTGSMNAAPAWVFVGDGLVPNVPFVSTKTRAEVHAEYLASKARGDWVFVGDGLQPRDDFRGLLTVAQVRAERAASQARGDWVFVGDGLLPRHVALPGAAPRASTVVAMQ